MSKRFPLIVAGIVFSLVALMHLMRLIYQWQIIINDQTIPMSASAIALVVSVVLALWMFTAARRRP